MRRFLQGLFLLVVAVPAFAQAPRIVDVVVPDDPSPVDGQRVTVPILVTLENPGTEARRVELAPDFDGVAAETESPVRALAAGERITVVLSLVVDLEDRRRGGERMLGGALVLRGDDGREWGRHPLALLANRGRRALAERPAERSGSPSGSSSGEGAGSAAPSEAVPRRETAVPRISTAPPLRIDPSVLKPSAEPSDERLQEAPQTAEGIASGSSLGFVTATVVDTFRTRAVRQDRRFLKALKVLAQLENRGPEPWSAPFTLLAEVERRSSGEGRRHYGKRWVEKVRLDEPLQPGEALNLTLVLGQQVPDFGVAVTTAPEGAPPESRFFPRPVLVYEDALGWYGGESFTVRLLLDAPRDKDPADNGVVFTGTVADDLSLDVQPSEVHPYQDSGSSTATTRRRDTP